MTKDADFSFRIASSVPPPCVVHLRVGNMRLKDLKKTVQGLWPQVERHLRAAKLIDVYEDRIEVIAQCRGQ